MTAIASTDVTVTITSRERSGKQVKVLGTIAFGDGALTYPSGGVPLPAKSYFRLSSISRMHLTGDSASGYVYKYDYANHKITMYQTATVTPAGTVAAPVFSGSALATHTHDILVKGGASGGIDEAVGVEGTDSLAKDAATDRTIVGSASATKGGVVAITGGTPAGTNTAPAFTGAATTAAAMAALGTGVAPAAITLYFEAYGKA
jgi:hypothetical protein